MINLNKQRKAFSMLITIILIASMGTIALLVSNITGKISKETTAMYQKEQAVLLAKSYTEYAIMAVMANDRVNQPCIDTINGSIGTDPANGYGYLVNTNIYYIGDADVTSCDRVFSNGVLNSESPLNIIVDVYVKYKEIDHIDKPSAPWTTYHKRSLQKI